MKKLFPLSCLSLALVSGLIVEATAATPVRIDIDPSSSANQINPVATGNVIVTVFGATTASGDPVNFDVTAVNPASVRFGRGNGQKILTPPVADIDGDTKPDMTFAFAIPSVNVACGDTTATLSGTTYTGIQFTGTDTVQPEECDGGCHPAPPVKNAVAAIAGSGGHINPVMTLVNQGAATQFTVTPDSGFVVNAVTGCGGSLTGSTYTTGAVNGACEVTAGFNPVYAVTASAGAGGNISPGNRTVTSGATTSFTITANSGFSISAVSGCGGSLAGGNYSTGPITGSCAVTASFIPNNIPTYQVSAYAGTGGTITPASSLISSGAAASLAVTPASGYRVNIASGCNGSLNGANYTTGAISAACNVFTTFKQIPAIEAYLSDFSVRQTEPLSLFVSTTLASYDVIVNRIAPLTEVARYTGIAGRLQNVAPNAYDAGPGWTSDLQIDVPAEWPSGIYELLIRGQNQSQQLVQERVNFVVRASNPGQSSKVLVVDNASTVQAYNNWGGKSLYDYNSVLGKSAVVALRRPGSFRFEEEAVEFANWAASMGYTLEWASSFDLQNDPNLLAPYETIVTVGHNEYWSKPMRNALDAHTAGGGNALLLSGNNLWYQVRIDNNTMTCYKTPTADPLFNVNNALVTTNFYASPVNDPENRTVGASWRNGGYVNFQGHYLTADGWGGYLVAEPDHDLFAATGLGAGDIFGQSTSIAGYEVDGAVFQWVSGHAVPTGADGTPSNYEIVAYAPSYSEFGSHDGAATFGAMQLPSGGQVINMATVDWADGLFTGKLAPGDRDTIADEQVGRITYNAFRQLGHLPGTPSIKGQPVYQAGQDFGVFVWKDYFDGPYHLVTNGKGSAEHLTVTVIASGEITDASSWNLAGSDSFEAESNSLQLDSHLSSAAEGVDFSIAPGEFVALGVQRQGGDGPFDIKLGAHRDPGVPRGWTISSNAIPHPLPSFTGGEDLGSFFGQDTPSEPLQIRWSSNGRVTPGSIQVLAAEASMTASARQLESEDQLLDRPHMVDAHGNVAGTDIDGFDISFEETPSRAAVLASMDGMFESRLVNDGALGRPDTVLLPQVTPRGQPVYDPGQDAALRVWLDDAGVWHVRGSAGGSSQQYQGTIIATQPLQNLVSTGLQPNDTVTLLDPYRVQFSITMSDSGEAGFSFETPAETTLSLDLDDGSAPLRVGGESWPVLSLPVDIAG